MTARTRNLKRTHIGFIKSHQGTVINTCVSTCRVFLVCIVLFECSCTMVEASSVSTGCAAPALDHMSPDTPKKDCKVATSFTTLVTGFFSTPGNSRSQDVYTLYMQNFLPFITTPMVIFTSTKDYDLLAGMRGDLPAFFKVYDSVWELPPAKEFQKVFQEQLDIDHAEWKEGKGCTAPECSAVWNSKPWMVAQAAAENVFNSSYFMWVDIASFRWGAHSLRQWPAVSGAQELAQHWTKVAIQVVNLPKITTMGQAVSHFVAGTWFGGSQAAVTWYAQEFLDVLRRRHALGLYVAQEQSIMDSLLLMQPDMFIVLLDQRVLGDKGWMRSYESAPGSANCSVWWYMQFHVQLASQEELLMHLNTAGCQRVPYKSLQPIVTDYHLTPIEHVVVSAA